MKAVADRGPIDGIDQYARVDVDQVDASGTPIPGDPLASVLLLRRADTLVTVLLQQPSGSQISLLQDVERRRLAF